MLFKALGIPVYIADDEAKKLMNRSKVIKRKLIKLLGDKAFENGLLNRKFVSEIIFENPLILEQVNAIVHPKVAEHFKRWAKKQNTSYCIKEAAILFESGGYKECDLTILVIAPKEERIKRVMERDHVTKSDIELRMKQQWPDAEKEKLADIVIRNTSIEATKLLVKKIHESLINIT